MPTYDRFTRHTIHEDEEISIVRIVWQPKSRTQKHDHGISIGSVTVISGRLFEIRDHKKSYQYAGDVLSLPRDIQHIVGNDSPTELAVSIHVYSPPIKMTFYEDDEEDKKLLQK